MFHQQIGIPKNIICYLIAFVFLLMVVGGGLFLFLHLETIEMTLGLETPFFNLNQPGNLFTWLFVAFWFIIAFEAVTIISITRENDMGVSHELFWGNVVILAILMSANTLCNFTPVLQYLLEATFARFQLTGSSLSFAYLLVRSALFLFLLVEAAFFFRYVRRQRFSRLFSGLVFLVCIGFFGLVVYCDGKMPGQRFVVLIQPPQQLAHTQEQSNAPAETTPTPEMPKTKTEPPVPVPTRGATPEKSSSGLIVQNVPPAVPSSDTDKNAYRQYHNVSGNASDVPFSNISSSNSTGNNVRLTVNAGTSTEKTDDKKIYLNNWEEIFGWNDTFEQKFGLKQDIESYIGIPEPVEHYLSVWVGKNIALESARVAFHYGCYGLLLSCVIFTFGLVIRSGKIQINKKFQSQMSNMYQMKQLFGQAPSRNF